MIIRYIRITIGWIYPWIIYPSSYIPYTIFPYNFPYNISMDLYYIYIYGIYFLYHSPIFVAQFTIPRGHLQAKQVPILQRP